VIRYCVMFFKEVSYAQQYCIYLIKNTVKTVLMNIIEIQITVLYFLCLKMQRY